MIIKELGYMDGRVIVQAVKPTPGKKLYVRVGGVIQEIFYEAVTGFDEIVDPYKMEVVGYQHALILDAPIHLYNLPREMSDLFKREFEEAMAKLL